MSISVKKPFLIDRKNIRYLKVPTSLCGKSKAVNHPSTETEIKTTAVVKEVPEIATYNIQESLEQQVLKLVEENRLNNSLFATVKITNVHTQEEQVLRLMNDDLGKSLVSSNNKVVGEWRDWIEEGEEFPEELRNKDGIVLHPDTRDILYEFVVKDSSRLTNKIYREFDYLHEHGTLQCTNEVEFVEDE